MRPALVLFVTGAIFGSLHLFLKLDRGANTADVREIALETTGQAYDVELTLTFAAGPDAFSLGDESDAPSLLVLLNGQPVLRRTDVLPANVSPLLIEDVPGVFVGRNEFFVQASPTDSNVRAAVRVRILRGGNPVADETMWPEFGGLVQGTISLEVPE